MKLGYARVSTDDQNLDSQIAVLKEAGADHIYTDIISGSKSQRKGLAELLKFARSGDSIIVYKLDRLGRSLKELLILIEDLKSKGINLIITSQSIDTSTPAGRAMFQMFGMIAEFERELIKERTMIGLKAARARGRFGGRPKLLTKEKQENLKTIYNTKQVSINEICNMFNITKPTLYRYLQSNIKLNC